MVTPHCIYHAKMVTLFLPRAWFIELFLNARVDSKQRWQLEITKVSCFSLEGSELHYERSLKTYIVTTSLVLLRVEFFQKFNSRGGWNKNVLAGKFWKN